MYSLGFTFPSLGSGRTSVKRVLDRRRGGARRTNMRGVACGAFFFLLVICFAVIPASFARDAIVRGQSVRDGDTLVSAGGTFELGFFSLGGFEARYVGVWFKKVQIENVVWVANRRLPVNDSAGVLMFGGDGNLVIQDGSGATVWSSSSSAAAAGDGRRNPVAQLLESGNLVIRDGDGNRSGASFLWQSFDEPGDTLLAGMRLSVNRKTGVTRNLTSWRAADDPSPGNYTMRLGAENLPHSDVLRGSTVVYSSGAWDGFRFSGIPDVMSDETFAFDVVSDGDEVYYAFEVPRHSTYAMLKLRSNGKLQRLLWNDRTSKWSSYLSSSSDCDAFALCGPYGICNLSTSPICQCLRGFRPRSPGDWYLGDGSSGCVRAAELRCGGGDGFLRLQQVKLPETKNATVDMSASVDECRERCAKDCACTAYARADFRQGKAGCVTWSGELVDVRTFGLQELYVRVPASLLGDATTQDTAENKSKRSAATVVGASVGSCMLLAALCGGIWIWKRSNVKREKIEDGGVIDERKHQSHVSVVWEDGDLPQFDFEIIASATNNFSPENKVGEGGFGVVYKGILDDGQEVAVKRLSWTSIQGVNEFMNEATLIAKLQHKNLVRLLGCCIRGEERMLIYEYMQNTSLYSFIFDERKRVLLDWRTRLDIILGIARGLMYLHHDSRFKIIHRDLKASNILLDGEMNPKISDFGTARIFGADQNVEKTKRVIGTYGYMAPEYAIYGSISVKSDVFSFGVLTLEILSGIKNQGIYENERHMNLLSHAWKLCQEGNCLELVDAMVTTSSYAAQITRCIQVALLCVQEHSVDRPIMSTVVMMLASENYPLCEPKKPGFFVLGSNNSTEISSPSNLEFTRISITMTDIEGR